MKMIVLTGVKYSGKTNTINMVYDKLTQGMKPLPTKHIISPQAPRDFECTFTYNGKKIAIYSMGDIIYMFHQAVIKYSDVDILIIALSFGGNASQQLATFIKNCQQHHIVIKTTNNNTKDCSTIISLI